MNRYILVALAVIPAVLSKTDVSNYPALPLCNNDTLSKIKKLQDGKDIPNNFLELLEEGGMVTKLYSTINNLFNYDTCAYVKVKGDHLDVFLNHNKGGESFKLSYKVKQGEGASIKAEPSDIDANYLKWTLYLIYMENGITATYVCSDEVSGLTELQTSEIVAFKDNYKSPQAQKTINDMKTMLEGWGFKYNEYDQTACSDEMNISRVP